MTRHNEVAPEHSLITTVNNSEKRAPRTTDRRLEIGVIFLLSCALWSLNTVWLSRDTEPPAWDMAVHQTYALNYLPAADLPSDTRFWERSGNYPPFVHIVIATAYRVLHPGPHVAILANIPATVLLLWGVYEMGLAFAGATAAVRSEERRVGKECRSRWSPYH